MVKGGRHLKRMMMMDRNLKMRFIKVIVRQVTMVKTNKL